MADITCRNIIVLASVQFDKDGEPNPDTEKTVLPDFNPTYQTLRTYDGEEPAIPRATQVMEKELARLTKLGYRHSAPHTVDADNHNWRLVARAFKPGLPTVAIQVVIDGITPTFDPWIF